MVLPALLNPFVEGAPARVMTRIARDSIRARTPFDPLFDEVAEDPSTRAFILAHFVAVMLAVARGHRPSPRAAFPRRRLDAGAALAACDRTLNRRAGAIPVAVVAGPPPTRANGSWPPGGCSPNRSPAPPPGSATATSGPAPSLASRAR